MIKSFRSSGLRLFWETGNTRKLAVPHHERVKVILAALDAATYPRAMDLPGLKFHSLAPGQPGRYSVKVSGNYRITFAFDGPNAVDVELEDYH